MNDEKIIELYFQRDESAVILTKSNYGEKLKALAFRILQNNEDAEECENDTYLKAWNSIPPQKPRYLFSFLSKICRNNALNILEKSKAEKRNAVILELTNELLECLPDNSSTDEIEEHDLGKSINDFLKGISRDNRIIFVRRYFLSESVSDISKALKVSESKVKSSLFRTRNKLREHLQKEEIL